jgi:hypothetical protein
MRKDTCSGTDVSVFSFSALASSLTQRVLKAQGFLDAAENCSHRVR